MAGLTLKNHRYTLILLHFVIFSIGLIKITNIITQIVYTKLHFKYTISLVYGWMCSNHSDPLKLPVLIHYLLSLVALFLFYGICFWVLRHNGRYDLISKKKRNIIIYLIISLIFNLFYFLSHGNLREMIFTILWFVFSTYLPFQYLKSKKMIKIKGFNNKFLLSNTHYYILTLIVIIQFLFFFYPLCFKKMLVLNEYLDIPEKTILENNIIVDNSDFIKQHKIGGFIKYDPRIDNGKTPSYPKNKYIQLSYTPMLDYFIKEEERSLKYRYDKDEGILFLKGAMSAQERKQLLSFYKYNFVNQNAINFLFVESSNEARAFKTKAYSLLEKSFIRNNIMEIHNQITAGWFFFHHSWMLNPILAVEKGAHYSTQPFIYGLGSAYTVKTIMKWFDGMNYQTYFKVMFSFYPIYFLLFVTIVFAIFKRMDYLLMAAILLSCSIFALGDEMIRLAPGYNPLRHLFDMPIFLLYFYFLRNSKIIFLVSSLILCIGAVVWSKDFGICLLIAISTTEIIRLALNKGKKISFVFLIFIDFLGLWLYFNFGSKNPNLIYMLLGFGTPSTPTIFVMLILFFVSVVSVFYVVFLSNHRKNPFLILSLSVFLYIQLGMIYFIWYPSPHHLWVISIPAILFFLTWCHILEPMIVKRSNQAVFTFGLVIVVFFLYLPLLGHFYYERAKITSVFSNHVVYDWKLKNAMFQSTMEPELFQQSIDLINKYSSSPNIYLISKYDSFLTVIANKYNAIPTVNIALDLISKKITNFFWSRIQQNGPEHIFMDTDINRDFNGDILDINDHLATQKNYSLSFGRAAMLTNLKNLSCRIALLYKPIEKGKLITVYKRREIELSNQEIDCSID